MQSSGPHFFNHCVKDRQMRISLSSCLGSGRQVGRQEVQQSIRWHRPVPVKSDGVASDR